MPNSPALAASRLGKTYGPIVAARDVSMPLHRGEVVALLGPNGAGKTTVLRLLAGLLAPTTGSVAFDGVVQTEASWHATRGRIGVLTETPGVWDRLSVAANLLVHARVQGVAQPSRRVAALLDQVGLASRANDPAGALSKGMRQKLALARALLHDPRVLLLDEPTAGLDPAVARDVRQWIVGWRAEGRAILLSTHNLHEAEQVADRVAVLRQTLVAFDTPGRLRERSGGRRVRVTLSGHADVFVRALTAQGFSGLTVSGPTLSASLGDVARDTPSLVRALVAAGAHICAVVPDEPRLEDIYLALLGETSAEPDGVPTGEVTP